MDNMLTLEGAIEESGDAMTSEWRTRVEDTGTPSALDLANAAVERADQAAAILSESGHAEAGQVGFKRAILLARLVARLEAGNPEAALKLARQCEGIALKIASLDSARFAPNELGELTRPVAVPGSEQRYGHKGRQEKYSRGGSGLHSSPAS